MLENIEGQLQDDTGHPLVKRTADIIVILYLRPQTVGLKLVGISVSLYRFGGQILIK